MNRDFVSVAPRVRPAPRRTFQECGQRRVRASQERAGKAFSARFRHKLKECGQRHNNMNRDVVSAAPRVRPAPRRSLQECGQRRGRASQERTGNAFCVRFRHKLKECGQRYNNMNRDVVSAAPRLRPAPRRTFQECGQRHVRASQERAGKAFSAHFRHKLKECGQRHNNMNRDVVSAASRLRPAPRRTFQECGQRRARASRERAGKALSARFRPKLKECGQRQQHESRRRVGRSKSAASAASDVPRVRPAARESVPRARRHGIQRAFPAQAQRVRSASTT